MDVRPGLRHCLPATPVETRRWCLGGRVQGVGFRPFVYRLALAHGLLGWVQNQTGRVEICTQGNRGAQEAFGAALINQAPPLARPQLLAVEQVAAGAFEAFAIRDSERQGEVPWQAEGRLEAATPWQSPPTERPVRITGELFCRVPRAVTCVGKGRDAKGS